MTNSSRLGLLSAALCLCLLGTARIARADINVAPSGVASQSTTDFGGNPERGNDGNTDGVFGDGSVTHTMDGDAAPFWQVDLGKELPITRVVVWNRTDCCKERLTNFHIAILDAASTEVDGDDFFADLSFPDPSLEWTPAAVVNGQTVRVDRLGPDSTGLLFLSLAEVQVFSNAADIAPVINVPPVGGKGYVGKSFTFTVDASGSDPLSYQWKRTNGGNVGGNSATLTINPLALTDEDDYTVTVKNGAGEATSDPVHLRVFKGRDLARDGEASQSSTGYGGVPCRANDGNTSGNYGDGSISHTNDGDPAPSWEVLLFGPSSLETMFIWSRTDCCSARLNNFRVSVLDADRTEVYGEDFFTAGDGTFPDTLVDGFEVPLGFTGQIVRIQLLGDLLNAGLYLSLAEVEVIGEGPVPPLNPDLVRREGVTVSQSSDNPGGQFPARMAVDCSVTTFSHTGAGQNLPSTWEANLGAENDIEEIVLWNRTDCCGSRLRDITVSILNLAGDTTLFESELLNPENEQGVFPDGPPKLTVNLFELLGHFVKGGIVRVTREPDDDLSGTGGQGNADEADVLSLGDVQIFTPITCPTVGDTHCVPFAFRITGPADDGPGVYKVSAKGNDDSGDTVKYTFTANNGRDPPLVVGPQASNETTMLLGVQNWTVSVSVDDNIRCDDVAADATCSKNLTIAGKPCDVAPFGVATQSSTGYGGFQGRAIDGITDGNYGNGSVTHTNDNDPAPSWEVELAQAEAIDRVVIWGRTDCCMNRLNNFRVSVLNADRSEVTSEDFFTEGDGTFPDTTVEGFEVPLGVTGKIVRIELLGDLLGGGLFLSLAEVEVFNCPSGVVETNCTDGIDNDGDSKIDCADSDCAANAACTGKTFHRGDADDNGQLQLTDAVRILGFLFLGQVAPTCIDAADADDNGVLQLTDAVRILGFLFLGQVPPAPPGPPDGLTACGPDPNAEDPDLGCESYTHC